MAAMAIALAGAGAAQAAMPMPRKGGSQAYRPSPKRRDTALEREIAEHNEAIERRKAEKRARKMGR